MSGLAEIGRSPLRQRPIRGCGTGDTAGHVIVRPHAGTRKRPKNRVQVVRVEKGDGNPTAEDSEDDFSNEGHDFLRASFPLGIFF